MTLKEKMVKLIHDSIMEWRKEQSIKYLDFDDFTTHYIESRLDKILRADRARLKRMLEL